MHRPITRVETGFSPESKVSCCLEQRSLYRAGRLLDPCLDPERRRADVLKAQVLWLGRHPELTEASGLGGFHEPDLGDLRHRDVVDLHVPVEELLLTKVLQPVWLDEGGSAARRAVSDGVTHVGAVRLRRPQTQLLPARDSGRRS